MRDEAWFEGLYRAHHAAVLAYARRRVADDADDVVGEVFATAWRRREHVPEPPLPWLLRTAAHHVAHARRAVGRRARLRGRAFARVRLHRARRRLEEQFAAVPLDLERQR